MITNLPPFGFVLYVCSACCVCCMVLSTRALDLILLLHIHRIRHGDRKYVVCYSKENIMFFSSTALAQPRASWFKNCVGGCCAFGVKNHPPRWSAVLRGAFDTSLGVIWLFYHRSPSCPQRARARVGRDSLSTASRTGNGYCRE
jgi:hypothetical protein